MACLPHLGSRATRRSVPLILLCFRFLPSYPQLNIGLVLFNLFLPAFPLDGGRILADLLLLRGVSPETAAKITASLATLLGAGVVAVGIWRTLVASVASVLTIAVGVWMLYGACVVEGATDWEPVWAGPQQPVQGSWS